MTSRSHLAPVLVLALAVSGHRTIVWAQAPQPPKKSHEQRQASPFSAT